MYQDRNVRRYIEQMPTIELEKVNGSMRGPTSQYLNGARMEYGRLARQLANPRVRPGSPMYMQTMAKMQKIQGEIRTLSTDLDNFKNTKTEFLQDFDAGIVSRGSNIEDLKELAAKDDYEVAIQNGKMMVKMDDGRMVALSDINGYFNRNASAVDDLLKLNQQAFKNGLPIDEKSDFMYRRQVRELATKAGREGLISLAVDNFLGNPLIDMDNPNDPNLVLLNENNHEALRDFVINNWMDGISSAANQAYQMRNRAGNMMSNLSYKQILDIWNTGDLEQITNLLPLNSKVGIEAYDDGTYDLKLGSRTVRKGIDPGEPQHLNMLLEVLGIPGGGGSDIDIDLI
tara:strand:- start:822 stop:1850 length:1029 start_codon:yes stop_codon:yes gene_type:complete